MGISSRGFITVASGEYYCKLAKHLFMSYKLFGNCDYPFFVITDTEGKEILKDSFDGVILWDKFTRTSVDKLVIFTDTPFDETIFIDADSSIVSDINYVFDRFEENGSEISAISWKRELNKGEKGIQFGRKAIEAFDLTYDFPKFNGGVYYFKKTDKGKQIISFMMNTLLTKYHEFELLGRNNSTNKGDEPVVVVAMIKYGLHTVCPESNIMYLVQNANRVKWNMKNKICRFTWEGRKVSPTIIHWKVGGTETYNYEKYDAALKGLYYQHNHIEVLKRQALAYIKFYIYPVLLKIYPGIRTKAQRIKYYN